MTLATVVEFVVQAVVYVGGTGAALYALFQLLGTKWLDAKFAERLEAFKNEQAKELERLRHDISSIASRVAKLHEREFEVLPQLWDKLNLTDNALKRCMVKFSSIPNLDQLSGVELEEFLLEAKLSESEKR